ncbi:GIY-YIG nuclease family protein [Herbiconiux daphne]|uniref:GIY-YIG nuclease family protein n=1 Tax=Herbiconiux daphne TaxID=2970914 RepID=UPI0038B296A5
MRVRTVEALQEPLRIHAVTHDSDLIYIGEAVGQTLRKRFLGNELRGKRHGTFFRSLRAVLG